MKSATVRSERQGPIRQFLAVARELTEASVVVVAFALAILMLGLPVALALSAVSILRRSRAPAMKTS